MLHELREEEQQFYTEKLPQIEEKLKQDAGIGNEMREEWLKRLTTNTDRSFKLSETLINDFAIKKLDEFKTAVKEKFKNLS